MSKDRVKIKLSFYKCEKKLYNSKNVIPNLQLRDYDIFMPNPEKIQKHSTHEK